MGEIFHILLINIALPAVRLNKPGQINRVSLRLQNIVHSAKMRREGRVLTLRPLKTSNSFILPFVLII